MNYGRGFPLPQYGNKESWIAVKVIPPENNGVGPNPGSWTAAMFGGQFPQGVESLGETPRRGVVVDDGIIRPRESESWMTTPVRSTGNGIGIEGQRDSWTTIHHGNGNGNGFVQNDGIWNPVVHTNSYSRGNGNVNGNGNGNASGSSSWTPVTPGKPNLQTSNVITANKPRNQMGNEDWGDLVGMYQGLLQKEPLNLNEVAQDHHQNNGGQTRVSGTPNKNFNPILNSAHVPNTMHNLPSTPNKNVNPILNSAHVPNTMHNLPTTPSKNFNPILNSAHVPNTMHNLSSTPNKNFSPILNSTPVPNTMHNLPSTPNKNFNPILKSVPVPNTIHNLNPNHGSNQASPPVSYFPLEDPANWDCGLLAAIVRPKASPISDPFKTRPQSNSVHDLNKTPAQNSFIQGGSMLGNQPSPTFGQKDGFPVPCRPCYDLNSPPRSELDAVSSRITGSLPFAPITPDTQRKDRDESQRIEDGDNHCIGDSTSSAVSTTQKEHLVCEEGDELGIDLNKTPNQKTPARRKKHRPKVIREGKPKRTQTPKDPNRVKRKYVRKVPLENGVEKSPNGKRKYVRKKVVDQSDSQPKTEEVKSSKPVVETPTKSCRRQLNFDSEHVAIDDSQNKETQGINLKNNLQDIEQERRINSILERSAMNAAQNNMHAGLMARQDSMKTVIQSELNGPSTPMPKVRDHAVNVLARNLTMRNRYNQVGPVCIDLEGGEPNGQTVDERRGVKRPSLEQINPRNLNAMDSLYMYQKLLLGGDSRVDRSDDLTRVSESHKKTKMQNDLSIPRPEHNSTGDLRRPVYGNVSAMQLVNSCVKKVTNPSYQVNERHFQSPTPATTRNLQTHSGSSGMRPIVDISRRSTQDHVNLITAMVSWNQAPATPPKDYSRSPVVTSPATLMEKKRTTIQYSPSQRSNGPHNTPPQLCNDASGVHQISFTKPKGAGRPRKQKGGSLIEDITRMLEGLCIYEEKRNALVPYRGDNNAIIPFEPVRKRKPRPKVDLDPETDRLWRLLMGNEGSEAAEAMDKDKEKWWEEERRVFRGRADSFIARMHLVQGDRRFSRWKGSVVDSVIGVFLTQNVSDHLSSSAFMSLAAKFNPKTRSTNETRCEDGACVLVEEPLETILPTDKISKQPVFSERPFVSDMRHNRNIISSTNYAPNKQNYASEELILSQDSLDSSTIQAIDESRSSAGSNSEAEDQTFGFETSKVPEKVTMFKELFSHDNWTTPLNNRSQYTHQLPKTPRDFGLLGGENISLPSTKSGITYQQKVPSQGPAKPAIGAQKHDLCGEDAGPEASSKEPNYGSHDPLNRQTNNIPKGRKGISEDEKKKAFDWDSLRRDVLLNGEKKERSKDATDSLDYEALRRAHVNEISDAIRERGMNNLLADRIKDFLDRLVRDHGSIDLEWLRDAPPDKAKDYLLSIRGLGLKSVECVRLLTLHHLAFPVDTNVGRIAVRLGWVPLQPLPESLQLHLLEMYPVLESIQKYLWPRLCKLDQLTLYELHYQMITFGKVFCTKSKPNCNACPMRAECRHFASAFASARLALPGPEEKRMVPSDARNPTNATYTTPPPVISEHMQLPPVENNGNKNTQLSCEPIIEEPTTPEPETAELSLSDIEDQYYDDADEIPTIKLDMNEFTANLQKMHDSMEIQGDMSKALVALNPQAASIPTPKLKNVSRLRTEHLVYELPDSHPLLEGLYKRETDDPSPYLLAIWTPGETAHSMQPPERGCQAQESGMLCDRTTCFSCNCIKEANSQVVRGTILMPCRTATRGSFPLNGTYFQVNEMFADHASSLNPIDVPRAWIWNLPRRTVYFGTSVSTIFKGLTTQEIQQCFWRGFVCVRGFDQKTRAPRPLLARLHFPASKLVKNKNEDK
ncbi:DNA glycosylase/AP lyase ROS1 isoform X2 [Helianthus annuus]|uniref:DNA glycosylase/AP lyase ROS1 isoform X2 n=1 Tax=Helianthus annuus TaxID=4232 RepID=UPI0016530C68|nr:DNA glycosylase/AP lyase ROS1 isoform X2 [Helianthus annuus]